MTVAELKTMLTKYSDDQPVFIGMPEYDNRCYYTEFSLKEHEVWLGKAVILAPDISEESDEDE